MFLCGRFEFTLERPLVMGIVNITPDSFSDGGRFFDASEAVAHARELVAQGADLLDIGGESTRPGAAEVSASDEIERVIPVVRALRDIGVPLSVDTSKAEVMRAALEAGADMINDVYGFRQPGAVDAVAASSCGLCIMHMKGKPRTMQDAPVYDDLLSEVEGFLVGQSGILSQAGVDPRRVVFDPGFGFGKTVAQNYALLDGLGRLTAGDVPVLVGLSRKSMIGHMTGRQAPDRLAGSLAAMLGCVARGAAIVRVHDVAPAVDALKVWRAIESGVET